MVVVDTSVIIDHLRRSVGVSVLAKIERQRFGETLAVSSVTIQELYEGRSVADERKEKEMLAVLTGFKILPYTYNIAKTAGVINRKLKSPVDSFDAAIAATAMANHSPILTLNTKDFSRIPELELLDTTSGVDVV